jgi:hypothetical protein
MSSGLCVDTHKRKTSKSLKLTAFLIAAVLSAISRAFGLVSHIHRYQILFVLHILLLVILVDQVLQLALY